MYQGAAINNAKQTEILVEGEERFRLLVESVKDYAIFMLDPRGYIVSWNIGAERIKGYRAGEIIGRHFSIFYPKEDIERGKPEFELKVAAVEGRFEDEDWRIRKDGSLFWANVVITAIRDENGNLRGFSKVTRDLTERKRAEEALRRSKEKLEIRVEERTKELTETNEELKKEIAERVQVEEQLNISLREKEVLLKEIHHRVKNNLQIISSLLNLQSKYIKGQKAREKFKESQNRVKSMALIHEKLYQSENLEEINFAGYIKSLVNYLIGSYGVSSDIKLSVDIDNISMSIDKAIPCGLITNEIVSNSLKHAFPDREKGEVRVSLHVGNTDYIMSISNSGTPFPKNVDFRNTKSLGLRLVCALVDQLQGTIELNRSNGTEFKITFPIQ
ncbi:MAG TPA: histidine kinase dimerization/phosphoacceptor domain -containing protein [Thermodesulfobacteriota bacterium]|nr:histidine kinase dimerization/phosphoacceptor domain -containing protein [Thermodesulfobacteriota bacterium]